MAKAYFGELWQAFWRSYSFACSEGGEADMLVLLKRLKMRGVGIQIAAAALLVLTAAAAAVGDRVSVCVCRVKGAEFVYIEAREQVKKIKL